MAINHVLPVQMIIRFFFHWFNSRHGLGCNKRVYVVMKSVAH